MGKAAIRGQRALTPGPSLVVAITEELPANCLLARSTTSAHDGVIEAFPNGADGLRVAVALPRSWVPASAPSGSVPVAVSR